MFEKHILGLTLLRLSILLLLKYSDSLNGNWKFCKGISILASFAETMKLLRCFDGLFYQSSIGWITDI